MFSYLNPLPQLPKYKGPHKVGSAEYEIPVAEIPSTTESPDTKITTIKFRVFYPTETDAASKKKIPWLPTPQKEWNRAYAKFLGFSERSCGVVANLPSMLSHPTVPAIQNAPLRHKSDVETYPVVFFSHGLGGNYNTYSSFVGSLASCGTVVIVPEHRDGSAPISFVRSSNDSKQPGRPLMYRPLSHQPSVDVLNARNEMLRIRLWELEKLYSTVSAMNEGRTFTNFADTASESMPKFKRTIDLEPGRVTWAGHSFGAATTVQFVKSVYYHQHAPVQPAEDDREGWDWKPLYTPAENTMLSKQITNKSPIVLLDLWTMPLTSKTTSWLWEKPLPCYDRAVNTVGEKQTPNVVSIMSTQFHKWPEMVTRTKALLSRRPVEAYASLTQQPAKNDEQNTEQSLEEEPSPQLSLDPITKLERSKEPQNLRRELVDSDPDVDSISEASTRTPSPARSEPSMSTSSISSSHSSPRSSILSLPSQSELSDKTQSGGVAPHLYLVPTSAHLSQSDFGVLFPNVTKYLLKTIEPELIMDLNVRAALATMRGAGIDVAELALVDGKKSGKSASDSTSEERIADKILEAGAVDAKIWERLDLAA